MSHFGKLNLMIEVAICCCATYIKYLIVVFHPLQIWHKICMACESQASESFVYDRCIHGYHEYKSIWNASVGEVLECSRKLNNAHDENTARVAHRRVTVGHIPR